MDIIYPFHSIQGMAQAVREAAQRIEGRHFSCRPWNRFDPKNTEWWIVPSGEWPAYRYGKGAFHHSVLEPDHVLCGLYVEKGLDPIVAKAYPPLTGRGLVMDGRWTWFAFLEGLADGRIAQAAQAVAREAGCPVTLYVSAWYASDPTDFDPHPEMDLKTVAEECRSPLDCGRVWFQVTNGELKKIEERCIGAVMLPVSRTRCLEHLPRAFQESPDVGWVWFDVYVGVMGRLISNDEDLDRHWGATEIWRRLLHPWSRWIV